MKKVHFPPDILFSPFVSLDQLITSMSYSSLSIESDKQFSFFLLPEEFIISSTCILASIYANLINRTDIKRIIVLGYDFQSSGSYGTADDKIHYILWGEVSYDGAYYHHLPFSLELKSWLSLDNIYWATHMMYTRLLEGIQIVPIMFGKDMMIDNIYHETLVDRLSTTYHDPQTIVIMMSRMTFSVDDKDHLELYDHHADAAHLFHRMAKQYKITPTLLQSEQFWSYKTVWERYQGVFAC